MQKMQMFLNILSKIFEQLVVGSNQRNSVCFSFFISRSIREFNFINSVSNNVLGYPLFKNQDFMSYRCLIKSFSNEYTLLTHYTSLAINYRPFSMVRVWQCVMEILVSICRFNMQICKNLTINSF